MPIEGIRTKPIESPTRARFHLHPRTSWLNTSRSFQFYFVYRIFSPITYTMDDPESTVRGFMWLLNIMTCEEQDTVLRFLSANQLNALGAELATISAPMVALLRAAVYHKRELIRNLLTDLRVTVRCLYKFGRAVELKRPKRPGAGRNGRPDLPRRAEVTGRDDGCVVTRMGPPSVIPELAHIIPYVFGKFDDGFADSPFYDGIRLLAGDLAADRIWGISGGVNVNSAENLMSLAPTIHKMVDAGSLTLCPTADGLHGIPLLNLLLSDETAGDRVSYIVQFRHPQEKNRHTTKLDGSNECVELADGYLFRSIRPGDPLGHLIMAIAYDISLSRDYNRGSMGEIQDLGRFA